MTGRFLQDSGARYPVIGGPMYPCSNPELVASVSEAGGIGIVQPLTLTYVNGYEFRAGLRYIKTLTDKPVGMNVLIEKSSKKYQKKMEQWIDIALEEGIHFFISSLGKPDWVVQKVHASGGKLYHDVTNLHWAEIAFSCGVDGFIAVNDRAGGHVGEETMRELIEHLQVYSLPIVCAGGISDKKSFERARALGYSAVQMGTRFIATTECTVSQDYKQAIIDAQARDIVLTKNITGVPVSVINTGYIQKLGLLPGRLARWMLEHPRLKHWARMFYAVRSLKKLKKGMQARRGQAEFWQAGKSVDGVHGILSVKEVFRDVLDT